MRDVRYAIRSLLKAGGLTAVAVITLALGIGASTAMFSIVNTVLLRPLPFRDPQRLVAVMEFDARLGPSIGSTASSPDFFDLRARSTTLQALAAYEDSNYTLTGRREAMHLQAETISANLFGVLGVQPALGRGFLEEEDSAGHHVVILSDHFWRTEFNADPGILGQTLKLNNINFSVVGVMSRGFQFPIRAKGTDLWLTLGHKAEALEKMPLPKQRDYHHLFVIARMRDGVTLDQVNGELTSITNALAKEYPANNSNTAVAAQTELEHLTGDTRTPLLILFAAVGVVLLIACVNVANLLLARSTGRAREVALRLAIGATRFRIVRQLVIEAVVLSIAGAALGIAVAYGALSGVLQLYPTNLPRAQDVGIDLRVLGFTIGIALVVGVLFGLAPALQASKPDLTTMREGGRTSTAGPGQNRLRSGLVIAETALGVMLVIVAGLLARSFQRLSHTTLGFNSNQLMTASFGLSSTRYTPDQQDRFYRELLDRIKILPGVTAATATVPIPLYNDNYIATFNRVDHPVPEQDRPNVQFYVVAPGFFETMQIPLVKGRLFDQRDQRNSAPVMLITEAFAKTYYPNEDPIGRRIQVEIGEGPERENYRTREVIGVVGDIRISNLRSAPVPAYYVPMPQNIWGPPNLVVRTAIDSDTVMAEIRKALNGMDPDALFYDARSMEDCLALDLGLTRFQTVLLSLFAGTALLLTAVGLYGVMAYVVGQRAHEIGLRRALGATSSGVLWFVMKRGVRLTLAGVVIGIAGALASGRFLEALLYEVPSRDPVIYLTATLVLAAVGLVASYIPALRATRVDPLVVLRCE